MEDGADVCWGPEGQGWTSESSEPRARLPTSTTASPIALGSQFGVLRADAGTRWLFTTNPRPCAEWFLCVC